MTETCPCGCPRNQHHGNSGHECPCGQCGPESVADNQEDTTEETQP